MVRGDYTLLPPPTDRRNLLSCTTLHAGMETKQYVLLLEYRRVFITPPHPRLISAGVYPPPPPVNILFSSVYSTVYRLHDCFSGSLQCCRLLAALIYRGKRETFELFIYQATSGVA